MIKDAIIQCRGGAATRCSVETVAANIAIPIKSLYSDLRGQCETRSPVLAMSAVLKVQISPIEALQSADYFVHVRRAVLRSEIGVQARKCPAAPGGSSATRTKVEPNPSAPANLVAWPETAM